MKASALVPRCMHDRRGINI